MITSFTKNIVIVFTSIILLFSCSTSKIEENKTTATKYSDAKIPVNEEQYLVAVLKDSIAELGSAFAFINSKHDTIIPFGKYAICWTDTLKSFAIVYDRVNTNGITVAIDRNENILFDVVFFDNWPDELHDGLFRVKRNGKIGFANSFGQIIIPCQFECAFGFENGRAKVSYHCIETIDKYEHTTPESDEWFYIDVKGNKISEK